MYAFSTTTNQSYADAIETVIEVLKEQGFGVLTEIDVKAVFKEKLDLDRRPYMILGACNPVLASKAIEDEPDIGLLLPCNVVVREEKGGTVTVAFMDPTAVLGLVDNPDVKALAEDVKGRLKKACDALSL
jgi:uncharacterized protein (DUF302 family)